MARQGDDVVRGKDGARVHLLVLLCCRKGSVWYTKLNRLRYFSVCRATTEAKSALHCQPTDVEFLFSLYDKNVFVINFRKANLQHLSLSILTVQLHVLYSKMRFIPKWLIISVLTDPAPCRVLSRKRPVAEVELVRGKPFDAGDSKTPSPTNRHTPPSPPRPPKQSGDGGSPAKTAAAPRLSSAQHRHSVQTVTRGRGHAGQ